MVRYTHATVRGRCLATEFVDKKKTAIDANLTQLVISAFSQRRSDVYLTLAAVSQHSTVVDDWLMRRISVFMCRRRTFKFF